MQTVDISQQWPELDLPEQIVEILTQCKSLHFPRSRDEVLSMAMGGLTEGQFEVAYDAPGIGRTVEATVARCSNGLAVNYLEPSMRRRDPECSVIGDAKPTDKESYQNRFGQPFEPLRTETFAWLKQQELAVFAFILGGFDPRTGHGAILIAPKNAGFFIGGLADLQEMLPPDQVPEKQASTGPLPSARIHAPDDAS